MIMAVGHVERGLYNAVTAQQQSVDKFLSLTVTLTIALESA